jgi:hypothetical protein
MEYGFSLNLQSVRRYLSIGRVVYRGNNNANAKGGYLTRNSRPFHCLSDCLVYVYAVAVFQNRFLKHQEVKNSGFV